MLEETLLTKFFDVGYFAFLVPFRIRKIPEQSWETYSGSFVQKVICLCLLLVSVLQGALMSRGAYTGKILEKPRVMFEIWKTLHHGPILGGIWIYTVFRKQSVILNIYKHFIQTNNPSDEQNSHKKLEHGHWQKMATIAIVLIGILFPIVVEILFIIDTGEGSLRDNFRHSSAQTLYDLFLHPHPRQMMNEEFTPKLQVIAVIYMAFRTYGKILLTMTQLLVLIGTMVILRQISKLYRKSIQPDLNLLVLQLEVHELMQLVKYVNKMNGAIPLCLLSASVPFFVLQVFSAWDSPLISIKFFVAVKISIYMAIFILSSEAHHRGELLKSRLLEVSHLNKNAKWSGRIFRMDLSLAVGYFGSMSFGVMGSIFSAYLSYAIMLLQIRESPSGPNCTL